jgi:hypothetical protein
VDLFLFINWVLIITFAVTLLWPLNIGLLILACKVRLGQKPIPYEDDGEYWFRFSFGTLGLAGLSLLTIGTLWYLVEAAEMQEARGVLLLVLFGLYTPAAIGYLFWMLALDDMLDAVSVFLLYIMIPAPVVLLVGWFFKLWKYLGENAPWLLSFTS